MGAYKMNNTLIRNATPDQCAIWSEAYAVMHYFLRKACQISGLSVPTVIHQNGGEFFISLKAPNPALRSHSFVNIESDFYKVISRLSEASSDYFSLVERGKFQEDFISQVYVGGFDKIIPARFKISAQGEINLLERVRGRPCTTSYIESVSASKFASPEQNLGEISFSTQNKLLMAPEVLVGYVLPIIEGGVDHFYLSPFPKFHSTQHEKDFKYKQLVYYKAVLGCNHDTYIVTSGGFGVAVHKVVEQSPYIQQNPHHFFEDLPLIEWENIGKVEYDRQVKEKLKSGYRFINSELRVINHTIKPINNHLYRQLSFTVKSRLLPVIKNKKLSPINDVFITIKINPHASNGITVEMRDSQGVLPEHLVATIKARLVTDHQLIGRLSKVDVIYLVRQLLSDLLEIKGPICVT